MEKFVEAAPDVFAANEIPDARFVHGTRREHFGHNPKELFFSSTHLALDQNNFVRLSNGWVADVNVSNDRKFEILLSISLTAKLGALTRWRFDEVLYPKSDFLEFF